MGIILETEISNLTHSEKNEIKNYILSNFGLPYTPKKTELIKFLRNDKSEFILIRLQAELYCFLPTDLE